MRYHFGDGNRGKRDGDRKKEKESEIKYLKKITDDAIISDIKKSKK